MISLEAVDDAAHRVRRFDLERRGVAARGNEGQHHHVGVAVEKHVLDEFIRAQAGEMAARTGVVVQRTAALGRETEGTGRRGPQPGLGRIHVMALHIEDEFAALESRRGLFGFQRGCSRQIEKAAVATRRRMRRIEGEEGAGGSTGGQQEIATAEPEAPSVAGRRLLRDPVRVPVRT